MKRNFYRIIYLFAFSPILLSCCKDDSDESNIIVNPVANFTILGGNEPAPHKVFLTNTSTGAASYIWEFGDGEFSYLTNPDHIFQEGGIYTISLTAANGAIQDTITKTVTILSRLTQVKLVQLVLTSFPELNNDTLWDQDGSPDVYFEIQDNSLSLLFRSGIKSDLQTPQLPAIYSTGLPYIFTSLSTTYYIKFCDYDDLSVSENMGGYYFPINTWVPGDGSEYPMEIIFESATYPLKFKLIIEWID